MSTATTSASYDAESNAYLQDLLTDYNDRDVAKTKRLIQKVKEAVEKDIDGEVETLFGGSVRKHTYVDGLSDVDVLMPVNDSSLAEAAPAQVLDYCGRQISAGLQSVAEVKVGDLAVTVRDEDGSEIQILPALRTATGVRIASADGESWSVVVRPQEFAKKLTTVNQSCGGRVVPAIKLFKGLQDQLPKNQQIKGYHIESVAIEAFREYDGRLTHRDMLRHLVRFAAERVMNPVRDTTGQSRHVDDYLGSSGSSDRMRVSSALRRLSNRLEAAERRGHLDDLKATFEE